MKSYMFLLVKKYILTHIFIEILYEIFISMQETKYLKVYDKLYKGTPFSLFWYVM